MKKKRKICVVTGSRAEFGLLSLLILRLLESSEVDLKLIATGSHMSTESGLTYQLIENEGFCIDEKVALCISNDNPSSICKSMALGLIEFSSLFERNRPDIVVILGDRYEIFSAAQAAFMLEIPIAHISGGEITEGALDDGIRHAITKLATIHFVSSEKYRNRVIQMGEGPERVLLAGDPALEKIDSYKLSSRVELSKALNFNIDQNPYFLMTYHPETLGERDVKASIQNILLALKNFPNYKVIATKANADSGGRLINSVLDKLVDNNRFLISDSLGHLNYLSAMKHAAVVVGNSSSGIVEAPYLRVPTVNIGSRQSGRLKASSIIDANSNTDEIIMSIEQALSENHKKVIRDMKTVYLKKDTSLIISAVLKSDLYLRPKKTFYDLGKYQ